VLFVKEYSVNQYIVSSVGFIVTLIPIFTLIWNMSKLASQVKRNSDDIDHLGDKTRDLEHSVQEGTEERNVTNITIIERLTRIETKLDAMESKK
jgi:hypothetical protein